MICSSVLDGADDDNDFSSTLCFHFVWFVILARIDAGNTSFSSFVVSMTGPNCLFPFDTVEYKIPIALILVEFDYTTLLHKLHQPLR
jgi:hypothetical protein